MLVSGTVTKRSCGSVLEKWCSGHSRSFFAFFAFSISLTEIHKAPFWRRTPDASS